MKSKLLIFSLFTLFTTHTLHAQTTETFETEAGSSTSFTDNGQVFNITSQLAGPFDIQASFPGTGWNGTSADNRYIDNDGYAVASQNVQFTISSAGSTPFKINSVWMYLSNHNASVAVTGSLTVVGKLGGVTQFTATASSGFNTNAAVANGFSQINFTTFGGSNNTGTSIDQLVFSTGGNFEYVALDAFTWTTVSTPPTVSSSAASSIGGTSAVLGGNVTSAGSSTVTERGIVWATTTNPTTSNNKVANGSGTGTFSGTVSSLPSSTLIYFRAYATSAAGTSYGSNLNFTTNAALSTSSTSQTNLSCNGVCTGNATVTATGGNGSYTYSWSPSGGSGSSASSLCANNYTCTITDGVGASITRTFSITQPTAITSSVVSQTNLACNGGTTGAATITSSGGTGTKTYAWTPGNPTGNGTVSISGLSAQTYTCTITDANSCTKTQTVNITAPSAITSSVVSQTNVSCNGGTNGAATITTSGGAGSNTYSWSPPPGAGQGTVSVTGLSAQTYTCTITDANSCTKTQTVNITAPSAITSSVVSQTNVACNGGTTGAATITSSGGTGTKTYSWSPAPGAGQGTVSVSGLSAQTYTCTITDANSCTKTQTVNITAPSAITSSVVSQTNVACNGGTTGATTITTSGGAGSNTYSWSPAPGAGQGTVSVSGLSAQTYTCTITDANSCTKTQTVNITSPSAITSSVISSTNVSCNGGSNGAATITASGGTGSLTYDWTPGNPTGDGTVSVSGLTAGTWTCTITDANSCTKTQTVNITAPAALANNTISGAQIICSGSTPSLLSGSIPTGATGTYGYAWIRSTTSATAGFAAATGTNNAKDYTPPALTLGTWFRRIATSGSCAADTSTALFITVDSTIANNTATGAQTICSGSAPTSLTGSTPTGGNGSTYTYTWLSSTTNATTGFTAASGTNNTKNYSPAALTQNTWYKRAVASGACANDTTAAVMITINTAIANNTATGVQTICSGSTPSALTGSIPTGGNGSTYTYTWLSSTTSATAGFTAASGTNNTQNYSPAALTQNTWYKRAVASGACANDTTAAVMITINTTIANNTATGVQTICSGSTPSALTGSIPTGGNGSTYAYIWLSSTTSATAGFTAASGTNNAQNYSPVTLTQNTWYKRVVVSGACANDTTAAIMITINTAVANNTATGAQTICSGSTPSALTGSIPTGGNGSTYTYTWLSSTTSATAGFTAASGTNNTQNYSPAALTQNTWYKRAVASGACANDTTAAVMITINTTIANNTATGVQTICSGSTPSALTGSIPTGGNGSTYTYTWLSSTTSATAGFTAASGTNNTQNYSPAALTQNTWYKRAVASGACANDTTAAVMITINTTIANNTATGVQTICSGSTPSALTGSIPTGGNGSTYTYTWLSSTTSATAGFTAAAGTNNAQNYSPAALTQNTWYRRAVVSGACANDTTTAVMITINTAVAGNTATGAQTICSGSTPATLTGSTPTGGNGSTYTYTWLSSTTSASAGFTTASGTNNAQNYSPAALTQNTWYKRAVASGACANDTTSATMVTVNIAGTWIGGASASWNNTANWSCPALPTSSTNVIINSGAPNMPVITDAQVCNNITIGTGASLTLNAAASKLSVYGNVTNNGTWTNSNGRFTLNGSAIQIFPAGSYYKVEVNNTAGVNLGGNVVVNDSLIFTNGNLSLGSNDLTANLVAGTTSARYIVTNGTGTLNIQNIGISGKTGNIIFPVGVSTYNPVVLNNTGTADEFRVRAIDSVTANYSGSIPTGTKITNNAVNRTWHISEVNPGGSNATVILQWNTTDELSGFTRGNCFVSHYNGTTWMNATSTAALGSNPFTQTRSGITSFSPFGVGSGATLPVEMLGFTADAAGNDAVLNWSTASEINNDHFEVLRSVDGKAFETIARVKGSGTTQLTSSYLFTDKNAVSVGQVLFYVIRQVDFSGASSMSNVQTVTFISKLNNQMVVMPNPFLNDLTISSATKIQSVKLTDMSGKEINANVVYINPQTISIIGMGNLRTGIYFLHMNDGNQTHVAKVIKE